MRTERFYEYFVSDNPNFDLVILGWTCLGRFEYADGFEEKGEYVTI